MQNSVIYQKDFSPHINIIKQFKIAIVSANFNSDITHSLSNNILIELRSFGIINIDIITVPGALEIPYALQSIANEYDGLIAVGCVIRGDTFHFEIVCNQSCYGVQKVSLDKNIPIVNGILTVNNKEQAIERINKSKEFAITAIEMILLSKGIRYGI